MNTKRILAFTIVLVFALCLVALPGVSAVATTTVTVEVKNSLGNGIDGVSVRYYDGSWHVFGTTGTDGTGRCSLSLTVGNYAFDVTYAHATQQMWKVVSGPTDLVSFQTTQVTMRLVAHDGSTVLTGINPQYYIGAWYNFGTLAQTTDSMELLPGNYAFRLSYNGASQQVWQAIGAGLNEEVLFKTTEVEMELKDHLGGTLPGENPKYYTGTWYSFGAGDTPTSMELLPSNYAFAVSYKGTTNQQWQAIGSGPSETVSFQTTLVTMKVLASDHSTELPGTNAQYYTGSWYQFDSGSTTSTMELLPGNYAFQVRLNGITAQKWQDVGVNPIVVFDTTKVTLQFSGAIQYYTGSWNVFTKPSMYLFPGTYPFQFDGYQTNIVIGDTDLVQSIVVIKLLNSVNVGLVGGAAQYYDGGWKAIGTTPANGVLIYGIPGIKGSLTFSMGYAGASMQKSQNIAANSVVVFQTTLVTMKLLDSSSGVLAGGAQYYASGWKTFGGGTTTATMELLPTTYTFMVSYGGASMPKSQNVASDPLVVFNTVEVIMKLHNSANTADLRGVGSYYAGGWKTFGTTEATMELLPTTYTFMVSYGGANIQKSQNVANDPVVIFQAKLVTMKLLDSNSNEIVSDNAQYYASGWKQFGDGSTTTTMDLLPTTYTFMVSYGGASMQKSQNVASNPVVIFNGVRVTLQFSGAIQYYASGWKTFTKPSMTLLPGTYTFRFDSYQMSLVVSSDLVDSIVVVKLLNSLNGGLAGGAAQYYDNGWKDIGTTPSNGVLLYAILGLKSNLSFGMNYAGARQEKTQNVATDSYVIFQTSKVSMKLLDSAGTSELVSTKAEYYAGGWKTFGGGSTTTTMELLPVSYSFGVEYGGARQEKTQNVASDSNVIFRTKLVTFTLLDSGNNPITGAGAEYYASGWKTFGGGSTTTSMEMLPLTYSFKVGYAGATQEKTQNVAIDPNVAFKTELVTMTLFDHDKSHELSGGPQYYASGWKTFGVGTTTTSMELLPITYSFMVSYGGASLQTTQNVASDKNVVFQTKLVTMKLLSSDGTKELAGGAQYYSNGWKQFGSGTTTATMELLPTTYTFLVSYAGASIQKAQDVTSLQLVQFQTGQVHSDSGTCTIYYAGGWNVFTQDMEFLPTNVTFHFNDGTADKTIAITAATVNHIH